MGYFEIWEVWSTPLIKMTSTQQHVQVVDIFIKNQYPAKQDGATPHFTNDPIDLLSILSRNDDIRWPSRPCDLTSSYYFLWGYVISQVYKNNPQSIYELKDEIFDLISEIEPQIY